MFLAHFAGGGVKKVLKMKASDIYFWYVEAVKTHNALNKTEE